MQGIAAFGSIEVLGEILDENIGKDYTHVQSKNTTKEKRKLRKSIEESRYYRLIRN
jgi:hypothetical protein